jgi:transposase InsO family protein
MLIVCRPRGCARATCIITTCTLTRSGEAEPLFDDAIVKHDVVPGQLTLHADSGGPMKAKANALLLADLGVIKSHSGPYTSNDNRLSESRFKTLKYRVLQKHGGSA